MSTKRILVLRNNNDRVIEEYDITNYTGAQELQARFLLSRAYGMQHGEGYFNVIEYVNGNRQCVDCRDIPV